MCLFCVKIVKLISFVGKYVFLENKAFICQQMRFPCHLQKIGIIYNID